MKQRVFGVSSSCVVVLIFVFVSTLGMTVPEQVFANGDNVQSVVLAGCLGCHRINNRGSSLARPLIKIYRKFDRENFLQKLKAPPSGMPSYNHLSNEMLESIFTYFLTPSNKNQKNQSSK